MLAGSAVSFGWNCYLSLVQHSHMQHGQQHHHETDARADRDHSEHHRRAHEESGAGSMVQIDGAPETATTPPLAVSAMSIGARLTALHGSSSRAVSDVDHGGGGGHGGRSPTEPASVSGVHLPAAGQQVHRQPPQSSWPVWLWSSSSSTARAAASDAENVCSSSSTVVPVAAVKPDR